MAMTAEKANAEQTSNIPSTSLLYTEVSTTANARTKVALLNASAKLAGLKKPERGMVSLHALKRRLRGRTGKGRGVACCWQEENQGGLLLRSSFV